MQQQILEQLGETPESLVDRYLERIQAVVYPMVRDPVAAEDVVQEVFVRVWRGLPSFQRRSSLSTWIYRITMNTVHRHFERENRARVRYGDEGTTVECAAPPPENVAMKRELDDEIGAAIDKLSPKLRAAVVLVVIGEMDVHHAAQIEGCTRATMYWRLHEAKRQLKKLLTSHLP